MELIFSHPKLPNIKNGLTSHNCGLDGGEGSNREQHQLCQINARNDYEAVLVWLNEYRVSAATYRAYQREAERLLLWSIHQHKKALSSLNREDFEAYLQFLSNPQPREQWCAPKGGRSRKRGEQGWKPFTGPLSHSAKTNTITIINSLFTYLVRSRYLQFNPLSLMRHSRNQFNTEEVKIKLQERILELDEWQAILQTLKYMPEKNTREIAEKERLTFIIKILFFLGLRINELETHTWNAFRKINGDWWFLVKGKGNKLGKIPVNDELMDAVIHYRMHLKKEAYPQAEENIPIILSNQTGKGLTARQINKLLKQLAVDASNKISYSEKQEKLRKFSAHWLRHLSASMQDKAGIQFKHIKENHRHQSDETTRRYVHSWDKERHDEMQKLSIIS